MTQSDSGPGQSHSNRRRSKWVPGNGQLKIAVLTFFVTVVVLLFNLYYCNLGLWLIYENPSATLEGVLEQTQDMMSKQILLSSMAALLLSILVSLSFYKILGPIYRFRKYFDDLRIGRWDQSCTLRRGDELQDVSAAITTALGLMQDRMRRQHQVLTEARQALVDLSGAQDGEGKARELLERIDAEASEYERRLGEKVAPEESEAPEPAMAGASSEA